MHTFFVYILANQTRRLYIGVTSDLMMRLFKHRTGYFDSYTRKFRITRLVYFETTDNVAAAIAREKQLKRQPRARKLRLIERHNAGWRDLCVDWFTDSGAHLRHDAPGEA